MRIVDTIMACYETEALKVRWAQLENVVDAFHVVQGSHTFRGEPHTPLDLPDFVTHSIIDMPTSGIDDFQDSHNPLAVGSHWARDKHLRDASLIAAATAFPKSLYLVCDGDEIPHPDAVRQAAEEYRRWGARTLHNDFREWYADWRAPTKWQAPHAHINEPVIGTLNDFMRYGGAHNSRTRTRNKWKFCEAKGWHLSNLGDTAFVSQKLKSFAHNESDTPDVHANLEKMRSTMRDATGRFTLELADDIPPVMNRFPHLLSRTSS